MTTNPNDKMDSKAQQRQAEENAKNRNDTGIPADKKLDGPNRPSV